MVSGGCPPFISEETEAPGGRKETGLYHSVGDSEQAGVRLGSLYWLLCSPHGQQGAQPPRESWLDWLRFWKAGGPPISEPETLPWKDRHWS